MVKPNIAIFCLIILLAPMALADSIDSEILRMTIDNTGNAYIQDLYLLDTTSINEIEIPIFETRGAVIIFDDLRQLEYTKEGQLLKIKPNRNEEQYSFSIQYYSNALTSKEGSNWFIEAGVERTSKIDDFTLQVNLPSNANIKSFQPRGLISGINGSLQVEWKNKTIADSNTLERFEITYTFEGENNQNSQNNIVDLPFELIIAIIAAIIIMSGIGVYIKKMKTGNPIKEDNEDGGKEKVNLQEKGEKKEREIEFTEKQENIVKLLNENETGIIKELLKNNSITQRKIYIKTGIPKSTLSRAVKSLEQKGIIEIKNVGNTNLLILTDWFLGNGEKKSEENSPEKTKEEGKNEK